MKHFWEGQHLWSIAKFLKDPGVNIYIEITKLHIQAVQLQTPWAI